MTGQKIASKQMNKGHAKMSLTVLEHFIAGILEPYWKEKIEKLPEKHKSTRTASLYQSHIIRARTALSDLRFEVEKMPNEH